MKCPKCGKENKEGAKKCSGCGHKLPSSKKKKGAALAIILAAVVVIAAVVLICLYFFGPSEDEDKESSQSSAYADEEAQSTGEDVSLEEDEEDEENETDDESGLYAEILDLFYYGISTKWEGYEGDAGWYGIESESNNSGSGLTVCYLWYQYAEDEDLSLSDAGYAFIDLDDDGICELLVDIFDEDSGHGSGIRDIYTYRDGEIVHLASSSERSSVFLCGNYAIGYTGTIGSGPDGADIQNYYILNPDSLYLEIKDSLTYVYDDDTYYYSSSEEYTDDEDAAISEEEAQSVLGSYEELDHELTPFSDYTPAE